MAIPHRDVRFQGGRAVVTYKYNIDRNKQGARNGKENTVCSSIEEGEGERSCACLIS